MSVLSKLPKKKLLKQRFRDDPRATATYLSEAFGSDFGTARAALAWVIRAQTVQDIARKAKLRRDGLYRTFGGDQDPQLGRILSIFAALDVTLRVVPVGARPLRSAVEPAGEAISDLSERSRSGVGHPLIPTDTGAPVGPARLINDVTRVRKYQLKRPKIGSNASLRDDPSAIAKHLTEAFAENDRSIATRALNEVLRAQNVQALGRRAGLGREKLYSTFGGKVDPKLSRLMKFISALDLKLEVSPSSLTAPDSSLTIPRREEVALSS